jgi:SAM-dependent methyltransferase
LSTGSATKNTNITVETFTGMIVAGPADPSGYWEERKGHDLYRLMIAMSKSLFPDAKSAIDVGCYTSSLIVEMDWISHRIASDIQPHLKALWAGVDTVSFVEGNAFEIEFENKFDLVISNQVIEHLEKPKEFVNKLLSLGTGLIISTTYETPAGLIEGHIQDPISMKKFRSWFPVEFDSWTICYHPTNKNIGHIIAVISQNHPNRKTSNAQLSSTKKGRWVRKLRQAASKAKGLLM